MHASRGLKPKHPVNFSLLSVLLRLSHNFDIAQRSWYGEGATTEFSRLLTSHEKFSRTYSTPPRVRTACEAASPGRIWPADSSQTSVWCRGPAISHWSRAVIDCCTTSSAETTHPSKSQSCRRWSGSRLQPPSARPAHFEKPMRRRVQAFQERTPCPRRCIG
jgi:hypothetical protein